MCKLIFITQPTTEQIRQIISLYRQEGWWYTASDTPEVVTGIIAGSHCFAVAVKDDDIVGMGRAISDRISDAYIQDVTVRNDLRGQGIGSRIIKTIADRLRADGIGWIAVIAERGSTQFYENLGFIRMPNAQPLLLPQS